MTVPPWGLRQRTDAAYFPMPWHPKRVRVDGEPIRNWDYDSVSRSLEIETAIREGKITVSR